MKSKKTYITPDTEIIFVYPLVNNQYDPNTETGLLGISGTALDASMGESNTSNFEEEETYAKQVSLWD